MASYVHLWYNDLLDSFDALHQQEPETFHTYHIEDTSICHVAAMAGLDVSGGSFKSSQVHDLIVYPPNIEKVKEFCLSNHHVRFGNTQNQFNSRNNDEESTGASFSAKQEQKLDMKTVRQVVTEKTAKRIDELAVRMEYR
jgi:hypothetical protein